jgi:prevent-host-death family protein
VILKNISEVKSELSALIEAVQKGEQVLIGKAGKPVARLAPYTDAPGKRKPGALAGKIKIAPDFDAPLPAEIAAAFGMSDG